MFKSVILSSSIILVLLMAGCAGVSPEEKERRAAKERERVAIAKQAKEKEIAKLAYISIHTVTPVRPYIVIQSFSSNNKSATVNSVKEMEDDVLFTLRKSAYKYKADAVLIKGGINITEVKGQWYKYMAVSNIQLLQFKK